MKTDRVVHLFILVFCACLSAVTCIGFRSNRQSIDVLEFTAPVYNLWMEENPLGNKFARSDNSTKIGVRLPEKDASCKFRVADVAGEKSSIFKAHARTVGDFVFLRIRYKGENPLNRELKDLYEMVVKATCKRKDSSNVETTTQVILRVADRNDASPVFLGDGYEATIDDTAEPFAKVLQVEASDADEGINSAIYYSIVNRSHEFFIDPITGWVHVLRPPKEGVYELKVRAEDRASRLFYFDEENVQPAWTADVKITVQETRKRQPKVLIEKKSVRSDETQREQLAAVITVQDAEPDVRVGIAELDHSHWFRLEAKDDQWLLYTVAGKTIPEGTNVSINVGNDLPRRNAVNTTALITIELTQRHEVTFEDKKQYLVVNELDPVGTRLALFNADLTDERDRMLLRYGLEFEKDDDNETFPFSISPTKGVVRISHNLNFERKRTYNMLITANLKGMPNTEAAKLPLEVTVNDGNDHPPVWAVKWLRQSPIAIPTNAKVGDVLIKVDAQDKDEGENGRIGYKLAADSWTPLKIDMKTGEIRLAEKLPKSKETSWTVAVWAVDWGSPLPRAAVLNLVFYRNGTKIPPKPKPAVVAEPGNRAAPKFGKLATVEVSEDVANGSIIGTITATDVDSGYNGMVRFTTDDDYFDVDPITGDLKVVSDLTELMKNGTSETTHKIKIAAEDAGRPAKRTETTLTVKILDANNNDPQFEQPWYRIKVSEDTKPGTQLLKVSAFDADGGENGRVEYGISTADENVGIQIDEKTGVVTLVKSLDREMSESQRYTLVAFDNGPQRRMAFVNLTIEVEDVNDSPPVCVSARNVARIPEDYPDGAFVTCIAATDADTGANARLRFTIDNAKSTTNVGQKRSPFKIDHHTGCVFVHSPKEPLDHQKMQAYNLTIDVTDNGESQLAASCQLDVEIVHVDYHHHSIEFDDIAKEASVYENSPAGTEVIMVQAKDTVDDKHRFSSIVYRIIDGDGLPFFSINEKGTVFTSTVLDREKKAAYWLTIEAKHHDASSSPRKLSESDEVENRAIVHVFVRVLDRNDHRPMPRQPVYFANVTENSAPDVVLLKVEATDADDLDNAEAPPLQFRIERGDPQSFFRIDPISGYLTTSGSRRLDREKQKTHELWVGVCDGGEPQLCSQVPIIVNVLDENDNAPVFSQLTHHYNVRAAFVGVICRVFATDGDEGDNGEVYYNITEGDDRFTIDANGNIFTKLPIHGDENYALTVQATDRGSPAQMAATHVVLAAVAAKQDAKKKSKNKNPEISGKSSDYVIPISDADQVGLTIGKLEATDDDGDALWWSIVDGNYQGTFDVRRDTGAIVLAKRVDGLPRGELRLNVSVTDGIATDYGTVIVQVARSPSRRPHFSASHYQTEVSEKNPVGTQIFTLKATGEDMGPGTKPLIYSIFLIEDIAMENKIRVEPSSGNVIIMESLDYERLSEIRSIIRVQQGNLVNYATMVIAVTDDNDNPPRFAQRSLTAFVDHTFEVSTLVAKLTAFDPDSGDHGRVVYSLVSGNEHGTFSLDKQTGELRLARRIEKDDNSVTILTVRASDGILSDTCTITVSHKAPPSPDTVKFARKTFNIRIHDDTRPNTPFMLVNAQSSSLMTYAWDGVCAPLSIHPLSGAVELTRWLTRDRTSTIACTVKASSSDGRFDTAKVVVKIARTNQHPPIFKQQIYRGSVAENLAAGSHVLLKDHTPLFVSAFDNDTGPSGLVGYRLIGSDPYFTVDLMSGAIKTRKSLDFEKTREWQFRVEAYDMGHPPRVTPAPAMVIVTVNDVNDERPMFMSKKHLAKTLYLPTANGIRVHVLKATDKDTVGRLRYILKDKEIAKLFAVNTTTGDVIVTDAKSLVEGENELEIFVTDGRNSASYMLRIPIVQVKSNEGQFRFAEKEVKVHVTEGDSTKAGTIVAFMNAINAPPGSTVIYQILNEVDEFFIHRGTGAVSSTGIALDREERAEYQLVVQAKTADASEKIAQTLLTIIVDDVNDSAPRFLGLPYDAVVPVGMSNHVVFNVRAVDADEGKNAELTYSLEEGAPSGISINSNGTLVADKMTTGTYTFNVIAADKGTPSLSTEVPVNVQVVDKTQPFFQQLIYTAKVTEKSVGETIAKVSAKSHLNGEVGYKLVRDANDFWKRVLVDWSLGSVKLLDAGDVGIWNISIEAVDPARPESTATAILTVTTLPSHLPPPKFITERNVIQVAESSPTGRVITRLHASTDMTNSTVVYSLNGDGSDVFNVDSTNGDVNLVENLDYEKVRQYNLQVEASYPGSDNPKEKATTTLIVEVTDVNDEPPVVVFSFTKSLLEDSAPVGQFIAVMSATDQDTVSSLEDDQKLLFSIVDGDETLFDIAPASGKVSLARLLEDDDLVDTTKQLNISVTDGIFTAYGQLTVDVTLSGRRQPPPRFDQSHYIASAFEGLPQSNKTALITVLAKDGVAPLHYSLGTPSGAKGAWPVHIDRATGRIHASRTLDYHQDRVHQIPLVVEDSVGRRAFSRLTLNVLDVNDQPPTFLLSKYTSSVNAHAKEGDTVVVLSASDEDDVDSIEYTLLDADDAPVFNVHAKQGTVTVAKKLLQKAGQTFTFMVKATDAANPPHHATTTVEINVAADGVPVPRFSNSHYHMAVGEDAPVGQIIGQVQQVDTELEEVRFSISEAPEQLPFSVERSTGKVIVKSLLDRERHKQWKMAIRADGPGGVHALTIVTVDVDDVNDHAPAFQGDYERLTIAEDSPVGTSVTIFSATDGDHAPSGKVTFSLLEKQRDFKLDEDSGWLTVRSRLDAETTGKYELTARATDEGGLNSDVKVTILVTDVNDSPPTFERDSYTVLVDPAKIVDDNQTILEVIVKDADKPPFNISALYILAGNEVGIFGIDSTGRLFVRRPDLLTTASKYTLTILAYDGRFEATTSVLVDVKQPMQQLECPKHPLIVTVPENSRLGTVAANGSELFIGHDVEYLLETDGGVPFAQNKKSGKLMVNGLLDYEKLRSYNFIRVIKLKSGSLVCREEVFVNIKDENDNSPVFQQPAYRVSMKENLPASPTDRQVLLKVTASDADSGDLGRLTYSLVEDHRGLFSIDPDVGVITVLKPLDRETRATYSLTVNATDNDPVAARKAKTTVDVEVADQNDNPPTFEKKAYTLQVLESEAVGYQLVKLFANGGDEGEKVVYRLKTGTDDEYVKLDSVTGALTLAKGLDYEKQKTLTLTAEAIDNGTPPLSTTTKIEIHVLDENDNSPIFEQSSYKASVKENSPKGTKVIKVTATDADSEHLGRVAYTMKDAAPFEIDNSGWIRLVGDVDFEKKQSYTFEVVAADGGSPPRNASVAVELKIIDENDNAPEFTDCNMTAVVQEGAKPGHTIMSVHIRDADGPGNADPFKLEIKGDGAKLFKFDATHTLMTAGKLQHSKKDKFLLTVVAKDAKGKSSTCPLTIFVKEESKHAPVLKPLRIRLNTLMTEFKAGNIGKLYATDEDAEDMLRYAIVEDSTRGPLPTDEDRKPANTGKRHEFKVDAETGDIWAEHSIPSGLHAFNVTVTDGKYSTVSYVEVLVKSVDADLVEHAVAIRIRDMVADQFFTKFEPTFRKVIAGQLNVDPDYIQLLSVQQVDSASAPRARRSPSSDVEVLLTAQRGPNRGYLKPDHIYSRLKLDFQSIQDQSEGLKYQLITEMCTSGVCHRGECRERIDLLEDSWTFVAQSGVAYVAPHHVREAECLCPQGYGGKRCELEINACARSPCQDWQVCVPQPQESLSSSGYECTCPFGVTGPRCDTSSCDNEGHCLEEAELSVGGNGYFEMFVSNEVETRLELELELKTTSTDGVVAFGQEGTDYHTLQITNGAIEYVWNCGSGEGRVTSLKKISDGKWHKISISRRQRRTRLTVDEKEVRESFSPAGSTVLNLHSFSQRLVFGAKVDDEVERNITRGIIACFRTISLDGRKVAKTRQGLRLYGTQPGCAAMASNPCSEAHCDNGGSCVPNGRQFSCICPARYEGDRCEVDTEPCASSPCPIGIQCIPFYNDYLCKCPNGFTGKRCESRGFDVNEGSTSVCSGEDKCGTGTCIEIPRHDGLVKDFICNCTDGKFQKSPCYESTPFMVNLLRRPELLIIVAAIAVIVLIACCTYLACLCIRRERDPKYGAHVDVPSHMRNTRVLMSAPAAVPTEPPPPLPPRSGRHQHDSNAFASLASNTNRPMVQVRPFSNAPRNDSRSPSILGKNGQSRSSRTDLEKDAARRRTSRDPDHNRARAADRTPYHPTYGELTNLTDDLTDSIQCLPSAVHESTSVDRRIGEVLRTRLEASGRLHIGETVLTPVINDDDYMTMRPRKTTDLNNSMPLLDESASENTASRTSPPPLVPAHKKKSRDDLMDTSVLYDDPMTKSTTNNHSASMEDIDGSDIDEIFINLN